MRGPRNALRPQDILIVLKLSLLEDAGKWTQSQMAQSLGISPAEVAFALRRLKKHHLINLDELKIRAGALCEFLVHGLKYVFPAEVGRLARGIPTASSHEVLKRKLRISTENILVWPDAGGDVRGQALEPLYDTVPFAAKQDSKLYELLSLVDALRVGGAREITIAKQEIEKRLLKKGAT
jgi:DNA-binding Lrp family transcriptional regulator